MFVCGTASAIEPLTGQSAGPQLNAMSWLLRLQLIRLGAFSINIMLGAEHMDYLSVRQIETYESSDRTSLPTLLLYFQTHIQATRRRPRRGSTRDMLVLRCDYPACGI